MIMTPIKKNIVANFVGSIWQAIIGLVFIPIYIKFLGIEAYGLIGVFSTLQVIFGLLDVGLGSTLTREMARLSVFPDKEQEMRNLVRTLEFIYWSIAIFVGISVVLLSPFIAHYWIKPGQLSPKTVEQSILIMGFVMVFQMPIGFYSGGLIGLQKQILLNVINICSSTVRCAGVIIVLWLVSPTIQSFLLWQMLISIITAFLLALFLWNSLPNSENKAIFKKELLHGIWKFAAGMGGTSIFVIILTQLDKIILSKLLSLEAFGYYMLASVVGMSLSRLFTPVFYSIYPRFTQLVSIGDYDALTLLYHTSCQFMSVLVMPIAIVVALFSYEIILLWTQNIVTAEKTHIIVSIMICGTAINGLMHLPYALQLAFGWTRLSFFKTLIAVIILVPLIIYMTIYYGATGAAIAWVVLNMGMLFFEIPIMHSRLLRKEMWCWYWQDVCVPVMTCLFVVSIGRIFIIKPMSQSMLLLYLIIISILTLGITAITTPLNRAWILVHLFKIKSV
ncbi:MAG: oligosaccharide flippase family protein [Desulfamplus sp.]|nr:oligosaccharide flippase family protein [Desulfamplus sp.]